jgi:hypothetical protein
VEDGAATDVTRCNARAAAKSRGRNFIVEDGAEVDVSGRRERVSNDAGCAGAIRIGTVESTAAAVLVSHVVEDVADGAGRSAAEVGPEERVGPVAGDVRRGQGRERLPL